MARQIQFHKVSWYLGCVTIVSFPVSISLSQASMLFAVVAWIISRIKKEQGPGFQVPLAMKAAFAIFAAQLLSLIVLGIASGDPIQFITKGFRQETKDVGLVFASLWVFSFAEDPDRKKTIVKLLTIAAVIVLVSGFVALFSKWRLSNIPYHLTHGWDGTASARYQHHAGTFFPGKPFQFHVYIPIGFLHSHLTYGAMLMFIVPALFLQAFHPIIQGERKIISMASIGAFAVLGITLILFLINNARSAMIGCVFAIAISIYYFSRNFWKKRSLSILIPIGIGLLSIGLLILFAEHLHERLYQLVIALTGKEKHTDYQRVILWHSVLTVLKDHPLLGVGPGHFQQAIESVLLASSQSNPGLWYANETLQRGHAHNDFLHLLSIAGPLCAIAYLVFFFLIIRAMVEGGKTESIRATMLRFGPAAMLLAGFYQCYFQDDAVMMPFWILTGLLLRDSRDAIRSSI